LQRTTKLAGHGAPALDGTGEFTAIEPRWQLPGRIVEPPTTWFEVGRAIFG
jgi:hypothetical protein